MSKVIECEICNLEFSSVNEDQVPRILKCGHSVCQCCATKLLKNSAISCPFCRETTSVSAVKDLQKNFALLQIIEHTKTERVEEEDEADVPPKCATHKYNMAEFVCLDPNCSSDEKLMCRTCEEFGVHAGHSKGLLQTEALKLRTLLKDKLLKSEDQIVQIDKNIEEVDSAQQTNQVDGKVFQDKKDLISVYYTSIRETLDAQEALANQKLREIAESNSASNKLLLEELSESLETQKLKNEKLKSFLGMSNADLLALNSEIQLWDDSENTEVEPIQFDVALNFPEVNRLAVDVANASMSSSLEPDNITLWL
ncbi:RING-type domain-containing protein [Caenorhabditis elegans]|uniref:RING-type domain-containing protein n=1 Tax=Caenorhabditis elegans TaxID=6239 RepID=O16684_CAEEL|nr:RING-type domain-containing protein [Caenorhabditis elegans]CCD61643.1 RING-type domain-containing protein [Caenorhabditis elegans]|eukprot:NP_494243.2 Uncharacterized protein CELE_ZK1240.1 [Caenorhabditis elegans]